MNESPPLVSIGLPVYNEERFVDAALAALRRQDHANLEILVCDNASTDGTLAICERHAAADPRIRIDRAAANRGATANFHRALELARGDYFMWAGGHDLVSDNLVSSCLGLLAPRGPVQETLARSLLIDADYAAQPEGFHLWLPLAEGRNPEILASSLSLDGLSAVPAERFAAGAGHDRALRISLGGAIDRAALARGLRALDRHLRSPATQAPPVI